MMKAMQRTLRYLGAAFGITAALLASACGGGGGSSNGGGGGGGGTPPLGSLQLVTLSNRADLVSDGDVLMAVSSTAGLTGLAVDVDGRDVTSAFQLVDGKMVGLVSGLAVGPNIVTARATSMTGARLTITNSPRSGSVLSGAQTTPYYCAMPTPRAVSGTTPALVASGLSGLPDSSCTVPSEFKYYYRTTSAGCSQGLPDPVWSVSTNDTTVPSQPVASPSACFKPYNPAATRPADMARTTTDAGRTVDYIVRVERGVINRGIYDMVALFDPSTAWTPTAPQPQWNGKVYFSFGASTGQPRRQVRPATAWPTLDMQIGLGFVVAMNSLTDSSRNSNRVLMAETVMMMKEHIHDTYGPIKYAMGYGCSGGSINSITSASIMPGLLDGVATACTYPDSESTALEVLDCTMLVEAYDKPAMRNTWSGLTLTQSQINARKAAINGHVDQTACHAWMNAFGSNGKPGLFYQRGVLDNVTGAVLQSPSLTNNCELPNSAVYNPANPATVNFPRCNSASWAESIWGKASGSANVRNTLDNVGVQYGLKALNDGLITAEEFVVLNETIGGFDENLEPTSARTVADTEALQTAYRSGVVTSGKQISQTAMIDLRGWDDSMLSANTPPGYAGSGGIHHTWFSFAIRDRLIADSTPHDAGNQALWRYSRPGLGPPGALYLSSFSTMDAWLTTLKADTSNASLEQKVRTARPAGSGDFCYLSNDASQTTKIIDMSVCDADPYLKPSLSPRQVAGGPRAENILKCQLKPLTPADYPLVTFSNGQWSRLQATFATGVCDWSRPGVGQQPAISPLTFKAGPGGAALPTAPVFSAVP